MNQQAQGDENHYETPVEDHYLPLGVANETSPPELPIAVRQGAAYGKFVGNSALQNPLQRGAVRTVENTRRPS